MKCKHVQQHLLDYSESQLDRKTDAMIEEHLRTCPACAQDLKDFEQTVRILQTTPLEDPPERFWNDFNSGVMRKVRRMDTPARSVGNVFFSNIRMGAVALATLLLVLGGALLYTSGELESRMSSFFSPSESSNSMAVDMSREQATSMLEALIPEELVVDILDSDFALLGGEGLSGLPTDANDETLYLLIESLDEREKTLLMSELERIREEFAKP